MFAQQAMPSNPTKSKNNDSFTIRIESDQVSSQSESDRAIIRSLRDANFVSLVQSYVSYQTRHRIETFSSSSDIDFVLETHEYLVLNKDGLWAFNICSTYQDQVSFSIPIFDLQYCYFASSQADLDHTA